MQQEILQFISNHPFLSFGWLASLIMAINATVSSMLSKVKSLDHLEVVQLINKEQALVIDIRSSKEFASGHIANSSNMSAMEVKKGNWRKMTTSLEKPIIVVCNTGLTAYPIAQNIYKQGAKRVFVLKDGIQGWRKKNFPLIYEKKHKK